MGEILVAVFLAAWLIAAGLLSYKQLKKDYKEVEGKDE